MEPLPKAEFAFPGPLRDKLVAAILRGEKISTTGLVLDYEEANEPLPVTGELAMVVDSQDRPVAVIQTDSVQTRKLGEVDLRHAIDEGEGFESVAQWREGHERFWRSYRPDLIIDDNLLLKLERFHVVRREFAREDVAAALLAEARAFHEATGEQPEAGGDPASPIDDQVKRVIDLAVQGLDQAASMGVRPWLTDAASDIAEGFLVPSGAHVVRQRLGWDRPEFLRKTTGRSPLTSAERSILDDYR